MNKKHGSPYDRGCADSCYGRPRNPHYYPNGTGVQPLIEEKDMTEDEIEEYHAGYDDNEESNNKWKNNTCKYFLTLL